MRTMRLRFGCIDPYVGHDGNVTICFDDIANSISKVRNLLFLCGIQQRIYFISVALEYKRGFLGRTVFLGREEKTQ